MVRPRKRFGQHWLQSQVVLSQILAAADLNVSDRILEIGPGTGTLTQALLQRVAAVVAVEVDRDLCQKLTRKFEDMDHLLLVEGDILKLDVDHVLRPHPHFAPLNKVVANIPYNITGPILEKLLGQISAPVTPAYDSIVLLVQQAVAQRLTAPPGGKRFGALSVRSQYLAHCELICDVPAAAFKPPPQVDSALVRLRPRPYPTPATQPRWLEILVGLGFASRRKMLRNNLKSVVERTALTAILEQLGVNPQARAEDLSVAQWVALSEALHPQAEAVLSAPVCTPTP